MSAPPVFDGSDGRFVATELARGPWDPGAQHGGAPAALLMRAFEGLPGPEGLVLARVTYEFLRPAPIGPVLASRGLLLVGLDVIGDYLTEINVTSPTCFQEITQQTGFDVPKMFVDALEKAVRR